MTSAIERLCQLPRDFRGGDKSPLRLVEDSGIRRATEQFTESAVLAVLRREPALVDDWLGYSADKRSGGWYVTEGDGDRYVVGTIDGERIVFDDVKVACASFIIRELDSMVNRPF
jgi:hypothetical protein